MNSIAKIGGLLFVGAVALANVSPAKAVTGSLTASPANGSGGSVIEEFLTITLSSSLSTWNTADYHANGIKGNTASYDIYGQQVGFHGPGTNTDSDVLPSAPTNANAASGQYNCWAVAHGTTIQPPSSGTNWDSGANQVTVTVP